MSPKVRSATVCFSVGAYQILSGIRTADSIEMSLVAEAFRRSTTQLDANASIAEIREYLSRYSEEGLDGLLANVKGIYHELIFEHSVNHDGDSVTAKIFKETNQPGADVEFLLDGDVIGKVQLKAVADKNLVLDHFEKFPEIPIFATSEVATVMDGVSDSGFSNQELHAAVTSFAEQFGFEDRIGKMTSGFAVGTVFSLALAVAQAARDGKISRNDLANAVRDGSLSAVFAGMVDFVLNDDRLI